MYHKLPGTRRGRLLFAGLCLIATGLLSCAPVSPTITETANGTTFRLLLGATLNVQLPSSAPGDGCGWLITQLNQVFLRRIDNADTLAPGTKSQLADGSWVETFKFQGVLTGTTPLSLDHRCNSASTGESFSITVFIVGSGV